MNQDSLLRKHALYQKSWTGWSCDHSGNQSRASTLQSAQSELFLGPKQRNVVKLSKRKTSQTSDSNDGNSQSLSTSRSSFRGNGGKSNNGLYRSPMPMVHVSVDPLTSRRSKRSSRSRPWTEEVPKPVSRSEDFEMVYEALLPKDKWVEFRAREYVTNPRYGQLYEVRKERPRPQRPEPPPSWLWEEKFRLWRFEMANANKNGGKRANRHGGVSDITRSQFMDSKPVKPVDWAKPHADLFAAYHNQKLTNQRRNVAAVAIQRMVRGWLIRKHIKVLKRMALLRLGRGWPNVTKEYRELVTRVQARHGVMKTSCPFSLKEMDDYLGKREKYEDVFDKTAIGDKLSRDQLSEFMEACGLYPTEGEITAAFNSVFRGSGSTAEVVFVLDCSSSLGLVSFHDQLTFVKDVVRMLDVGPDRVRVGVVPYNTDVFQVSGLLQHRNQAEVLNALDQIKFCTGLTHTDIALTITRNLFKDSRPGVQKLAIVVTDGQSLDRRQTALEAKKVAQDNITVFAVGVGNNVEEQELHDIARDESRVFKCSSYRALIDLKHVISSKLCLQSVHLKDDAPSYPRPKMNLSKQSSAKSPMQSGSGTADSDSHRATQSATNGGDASESIGVETGARKPLEKRPFSSVQSMEADCENDQNKSPNSDVCDYHSKAIPTRYSSTGCEGQIASKEIDGRAEDERGKDQRDIRTAELDGDADNDMTSTASVVTTSSKVITTDRKWVSEESDDEPGFVTSGKQTTIWTANEGHQFAASSDTSAVTTTTSLTTSSASITSDYHHHTSSTSMTSDTSHRPTTSDVTTARKPGVGRNACSCHGEKSISSYSENCVNDNDKDNNDYGYRHPFPPYSARGKAETCSSSGISGVTCSPSSSSFSSALLDEGNKREEGGLLLRGSVQDVCRPLSKTEALDVVWTIYPPPAARLPERSSRWIRPVVDGVEAWSFLDDKLIKATDFKVCLGLVVKARLEREGVVTIPSDVRAGVEEVTSYDEAMQKIEEYLLKKSKQG